MARYRLPDDVKLAALAYVKGYPRLKAKYMREFNDIVSATSFPFDVYKEDSVNEKGEPCKIDCLAPKVRVEGQVGNPTEQKALKLELLQRKPYVKRMRAVEKAMDLVGDRIRSEEVRDALVEAVMLSCMDRKEYTYEKSQVVGLCRTEFYAERRRFLWYVAKYSDLIEEDEV